MSSSTRYYQPPPSSVSGTTSTTEGDVAQLTYDPIDEAQVLKAVRDPGAGATCLFVGTTRDNFQGRGVSRLEYEAYTALAIKTLHDILLRARASPPPSISSITNPSAKAACCDPSKSTPDAGITRLHIVHRLGVVPVSEPSIAIACSSPHRREAFAVAEWALEEVKRSVQIWKREVYSDGSVAVARDGEAASKTTEGTSNGEHSSTDQKIRTGTSTDAGVWKANFPA
ncbi:hypothetical protein OC861_002812 [Tilletia horrida]|nr:hypothetical protein OC861_002812 [Tilletia horrida]